MANDVVQLVVVGTVGNEFFENVFNFQSSIANDPHPGAQAEDLVNAWQSDIETTTFSNCLPNDLAITGYKAKRINNTGGPTYMRPISPVNGNRPAACLVSSLAPVVTASYVETSTMKHRTGRIFIPGIADGDVIQNELAAGLITALQAFSTAMFAAISGAAATYRYGIWSRKYSRFYVPDAMNISLLVGTQRRRLHPVL